MPDLIGKTLGPYRIVGQIGLGGMATVFKAYQPSMDRYVALKVLSTHLTQDANFIKRFQQEAKIIAKLEHLHILPVYDHGEDDGYLYLVMRYIEAGTLSDRLKRGCLSLEEARRVVSQVGSALEYAHQLGVVHRDIKPSNVLIDPQGDCYLTDFGIAKMIEGTLGLTGSAVIGTPHYMAPEQSQSHTVDHRADVYSMGVVIYEMVTGRVPYDAETPFAVVMKHMTEPLPLPRNVKPDLPEQVERVILKALAKNPADRYQSMRDLVTAFDQAVQAASAETVAAPLSASSTPNGVQEKTKLLAPTLIHGQRRWPAALPLWLLPAAGLALVVLVLAGVILSQIPGRVEIAGGQVQLVTPTVMATTSVSQATPTSGVALAVVPTATPGPTSMTQPTAIPTSAAQLASLAALKWEKHAAASNFRPVALNAIAVDPKNPDTVFVGTYGAGIYVSRDGGKTWRPSSDGLGKGTVGQIVVNPRDSNIVYGALFDQGGIYKSTDGGRTWQAANKGLELDKAWNWTGLIYLDPNDPDRLYYSDTTSGLYRSTDAGGSWNLQNNECPPVTNLAIDPSNGDHLYAAGYEHPSSTCRAGAYESMDAGHTWKRLTPDAMIRPADQWGGDWWHLAVDPHNFKTLYAGGQAGTYKSSDSGQTWKPVPVGQCDWLAVHPDSSVVYCGQGGQVQVSRDGGATWSSSRLGPGWGGQERFPFAFVPGTQTIYAGNSDVMKSTDGGSTWNNLGWLGAARVRLIVDPRDGTRLFLSGVDNPAETYRSTDGGKSWQRIADQTNSGSRLTIDSVQNVIYRPDGDKLYRSEDNGQTWEQFGAGYLTHSPWQILPDPQNAKKLWLVGECGTRLAVSEDNGKTFLEAKGFADDLCQPILLIDKSGQRMYIVNWGSFYRSDDGGNTWRSVGEVSGIYRSAALDPSDPNVVYLGSTHRGVLKTTNGGQSWSQMNAGLNAASINDLAINPANPQMVYAATDGGAFVTVDGGENWSPVREGLGPNPIVYSIAVDPGDSSKVYAVAPDGVFRLSGTAPTTAASP